MASLCRARVLGPRRPLTTSAVRRARCHKQALRVLVRRAGAVATAEKAAGSESLRQPHAESVRITGARARAPGAKNSFGRAAARAAKIVLCAAALTQRCWEERLVNALALGSELDRALAARSQPRTPCAPRRAMQRCGHCSSPPPRCRRPLVAPPPRRPHACIRYNRRRRTRFGSLPKAQQYEAILAAAERPAARYRHRAATHRGDGGDERRARCPRRSSARWSTPR